MPIEFHCPHCDKLLRTADDKAGLGANCPGCGAPIQVPYADSSPSQTEGGEFDIGEEPVEYGSDDSAAAAPPLVSDDMKACPMCGAQIRAAAVKCRYCGETFGKPAVPQPTGYLQPHRAGLILTMGILSWVVCIVFGVIAWVMGSQDLQAMADGRMDPSGEGMTKAGKIVGMVHVIFFACIMLLYCIIFGIMGLAGGFN